VTEATAPIHDAQHALAGRSSPLRTLLRFRVHSVRNQIRHIRRESLLKIFVVSTLGLTFWAGLFVLFLFGFQFVNDNAGAARPYLIHHILSLFFMALAFMLVFSNAVIALQNLFKEQETAFLFALPLRHDTIFIYKFIESLVFSSWAVFAAGLPLMLAYGIKSEVDWYFYPLVLAYMIPFVVLPAAIGTLLGLLLMTFLPRHGYKVLGLMVVGLIVGAIYLYVTIFHGPNTFISGYGASEVQASVQRVLGRLSFTQHVLTPNYWITEGLLRIGDNKPDSFSTGGMFFGALLSSAVFFLTLGWFLSGTIYASTYSFASAGGSSRQIGKRSWVEWVFAPALARWPQIMILVVKDIKTFLRDATQWSQVLIFFGILALYIGNLRNFSYPLDQPFYQNLISFLNLGATCMTLATMTSRFIFPLISLEGRRFWVLGLVPLDRKHVMISKFYFAFSGSLVLVIALVLLSNYILRGSTVVLGIQLITGVFIAMGLSGLSVGMGAIFPSFQERNPSKIVSGFGGTLTLIMAISLVIFSILGEGLVCHKFLGASIDDHVHTEMKLPLVVYASIAAIAVFNGLAAYIPMKLGIRALRRVEF
jgi:ABC-2 type transport system permease protein